MTRNELHVLGLPADMADYGGGLQCIGELHIASTMSAEAYLNV